MTFLGSRRWTASLKSRGITQARAESVNWQPGSGTARGTFSASVNRCAEAVYCHRAAPGALATVGRRAFRTAFKTANTYIMVYALQTGVSISGTAPVFGGIVGKTITAGNSGTIHYNTRLNAIWPDLCKFILSPSP